MTTKRKKKKTMSIIFIILLIISGIGGKYLMDKRTEHERQVAFLKEHEAEMTEYIKSQNEKIETVEYDWDSVEVGTIGNGTPQGAGKILKISARVNKTKYGIILGIEPNWNNLNEIEKINTQSSSLYLLFEGENK
jgi:hypothetical protein